jgi:hypothetical protein
MNHRLFNWELWPKSLFLCPLVPFWAWYCLRGRSFWFFTATNPGLTFGGFEGEGKKEMYEKLPNTAYPKTLWLMPDMHLNTVLESIKIGGFTYPFYAKPEVGMSGSLCKKIKSETELKNYHLNCPVEYMVQAEATFPFEFSVFNIRYPGNTKGKITGLCYKELPKIRGNGVQTIQSLIDNHKHRPHFPDSLLLKKNISADYVPYDGEVIVLSDTANRKKGTRMVNLNHLIDDKLTIFFDGLSHHSKDFFYGRFDVKSESINALREGQHYSIIEFNGCGAALHHIYNRNLSLFDAWITLLRHWRAMCEISLENQRLGTNLWRFKEGLIFLWKSKLHFKRLKHYDL